MENDLPTTGDINLDHAVKQWLQFDKVRYGMRVYAISVRSGNNN